VELSGCALRSAVRGKTAGHNRLAGKQHIGGATKLYD
jgi:hypothetical protein